MPGIAVLDYETRSTVDIESCGVAKYCMNAEVIAVGYKLPGGVAKVNRVGFDPEPHDLYDFIRTSHEPIWAHNAEFERWTTRVCVRKSLPNFPDIPTDRWRCSRVLASYWGYPAALEKLTGPLKLQVAKDMVGNKAMLRCSQVGDDGQLRPRPSTTSLKLAEGLIEALRKNGYTTGSVPERCEQAALANHALFKKSGKKADRQIAVVKWALEAAGVLPSPASNSQAEEVIWASDWLLMWPYCVTDVVTQEAVVNALPPAPDSLWNEWLVDCEVNDFGVPVDTVLAKRLSVWNDMEVAKLCDKLPTLTGGQITAPTQREKILEFVNQRLPSEQKLPDLTADVISDWLDNPDNTNADSIARQVIEIRSIGSKTSASKFQGFCDRAVVAPDGSERVYGVLGFHLAHTGRWTSRGIQLHNLPQGKWSLSAKALGIFDKEAERLTGEVLVEMADLMREIDPALILPAISKDPMVDLSSWIRTCIWAPPGHEFAIADFAGVEGRGLAWFAFCETMLDIFRSGRDPYKELASDIYCKPVSEINKDERKVGKYGILGLGYGMGWKKFRDTVFKFERVLLEPGLCKRVIDAYRAKFPEVQQLWYGVEAAAIRAVLTPGSVQQSGRVFWSLRDRYLCCMLPSGRIVNYVDPAVHRTERFGQDKFELTYWGVDSKTKTWSLQRTYGGKLVENIVQAACRDLLAASVERLNRAGHPVPFHVHDEAISLVKKGSVLKEEFHRLMTVVPEWAAGFPIESSVMFSTRYRK